MAAARGSAESDRHRPLTNDRLSHPHEPRSRLSHGRVTRRRCMCLQRDHPCGRMPTAPQSLDSVSFQIL